MTFDKIKEEIAIAMDMRCFEQWGQILDNTNPGHYGAEMPDFQIRPANIWVDIQARTFTFKKGTFSCGVRLGSSRDGTDVDFSLTVSGQGTFQFGGPHGLEVEDFSINESIDLFGDDVRLRSVP